MEIRSPGVKVQAALELLTVEAGGLDIAVFHRLGAVPVAHGDVALLCQRVARQAVLMEIEIHLRVRPIKDRIDFKGFLLTFRKAAFGASSCSFHSGTLAPAAVDWSVVEARLQTAGMPDPDLIIRTSGEFRLSNFLLLQSAYAEIVFASVFWPDFDKAQLQLALAEYAKRERRFGQTREQLQPSDQR